MKNISILSIAAAMAILSGCGSSTNTTATDTTQPVAGATTITVERGPIIGADVVDASGQVATELANGKYSFASQPTYPIVASKGVIDLDRDGKVSLGDVVNDMNLTTVKGNVITLLTTLETNPQTQTALDAMLNDLNLTQADVFEKTPSESLKVEAISNALYRYAKTADINDLNELNTTAVIRDVDVLAEYDKYMQDDAHDTEQEEKDLVDSLATTSTTVQKIENEAELSDIETELENEIGEDEIAQLTTHLINLKHDYELEHGDVDYEDEGEDAQHYQGQSCAQCHSTTGAVALNEDNEDNENNEAGENAFSSGATVYTLLHGENANASQAASGYSLRLVLQSGIIESYRLARGTGNVYANVNAGLGNYTVEVLDRAGNVVNRSATNSHNDSRLDCNSCHSLNGANGAPGRIVSFMYQAPVTADTNNTAVPLPVDTNTTVIVDTNTTTSPLPTISFANDVLPILNNNCASCHGNSGNFSITNSTTPYAGVTPFVDTANPTNSSLLQKGSGSTGHGGGIIINIDSVEYTTVRDWIAAGALDN
ncbi:hypothetical protein FJR45_00535 [Sulfurimonas sediminis]|uniref:Cytochrome c domain-containing protein n=1 Tax=Sulfurimonas sediminis TaxID=2590020 RepID=A0A7M1AYK0_9BACT|nr:hypothetical protein [Sulfurimonas sediminis]QOP42521.1 hypothetical protein FJR45_00535 [Sulfurimonas sediminis]